MYCYRAALWLASGGPSARRARQPKKQERQRRRASIQLNIMSLCLSRLPGPARPNLAVRSLGCIIFLFRPGRGSITPTGAHPTQIDHYISGFPLVWGARRPSTTPPLEPVPIQVPYTSSVRVERADCTTTELQKATASRGMVVVGWGGSLFF